MAFITVDVALAIYLIFAVTSWNKPVEEDLICTNVEIFIEDENTDGFLNTAEIKNLLTKHHVYPLSRKVSDIDTRLIENELLSMPFVKTAQCYLSQDGCTTIRVTQRTPIVRVKAENGEDYYIDDAGGVMPNSQYTSDMIIVTGHVTKKYACDYISLFAEKVMDNDFWHNQVEQINVLPDSTIEVVPRVGEHIINFGLLPHTKDAAKRRELVSEYIDNQFHRMEIFYRYGLTQAGWERYSYISLEFPNQIVCTKRDPNAKAILPTIIKEVETDTTKTASPPQDGQQQQEINNHTANNR